MKILYLSNSDIKGGAARGAFRLHQGFLQNGVDSQLLVSKKYSDDYTVIGPQAKIKKAFSFVRPQVAGLLLKAQKSNNPICRSINILPSNLHKFVNASDADVVMLHWVGGEMLSIAEIGKINKPIVWRLADQWAFCGAEHYTLPGHDARYTEGYTKQNRPEGDTGLDIDKWAWKRKVKHWLNKDMTIVTGSNWLADCARSSYLHKNKNIEVIPSGIDTNVYKPIDKQLAREILNLPQDKRLILFGSMSASSDPRKGFHLLLPALQALIEKSNINMAAVVFGASRPQKAPDFKMPSYYLSTLQDDWSLALAYSAADVFVLPTMQDNLPYTVIEAMCCQTPSVSFDVGGLPDLIDHMQNGYLAPSFDTDDLAEGLKMVLENDALRHSWSQECRKKALREYDVNAQVSRYLNLFDNIL